MAKKLTIGFLFSTLLLVASEYLLLREVFAAQRVWVIVVGLAGVVAASFLLCFFFMRYRRALKDL